MPATNPPPSSTSSPSPSLQGGPRPVIFLDRDDTVIANREATSSTPHPGDLLDPSLVRLLPGAGEALRDLVQAGHRLVFVTNQGGVAQGFGTLRDVERVNERMRELLIACGVPPVPVYFSPARGDGVSPRFRDQLSWRKPAPGMLLAAATELNIDLSRSWMIGDAPRDVESGLAAGLPPARCLLIGPGARWPTIVEAVRVVLGA
ncbi:MAG: HAD-IIIA family hydrolase [Planctomycetota bacterium]|nr:HAD-IIIA family hydrolase [Planctomycetota bacterium]